MAVLVTGGAGYIGSHTCVELLSAGYDIVLLDNFSNSRKSVVGRIRELGGGDFPVYETDVLDETGLRRVFQQEPVEAVIHFAGLKAVGESVRRPIEYYRNNVGGALNLCRIMAASGCKRMIFSSSATVYGEGGPAPFREDYPVSATNPYGMTKLVVERILRDMAAADGAWGVVSLRYFNPIGAHPSGLLGEDPDGVPNNLVPYIAQVAAGKLDCLTVYGDDYGTKDGTGVRDYLHVTDLALGHLRALEYAKTRTGAEAINLGTGTGYTVMEVIRAFERACGRKINYRIAARRPGDVAVSFADTAKARELLHWEAGRSLDEMCADMWNFIRRC